MPKVVIDGIELEVPAGTTILKAAAKVGIDIPAFCYHPYLKPAGICRMCLVEVKGNPRLLPACITEVQDGWEIYTNSDAVKEARKWLLEFLIVNHPLDCPICDQAGDCELQDFVFKYGEPEQRLRDESFKYPTRYLGPLIVHQMSRCILCRRCVRFGEEVMGGADWGAYERGHETVVGPYESEIFADRYTFNMEALCPVGAITTNIYRYKTRIWKLDFTPSVCAHCEVGCWLDLGERDNQLLKVKHTAVYPSPWICDRGGYGFEFVNHSERILVPLKREGNKMKAVSWKEALGLVVGKIKELVAQGGKVAALASPHLTCEDYLLLGRFMKEVVGSDLVDYRLYGGLSHPEKTSLKSLDDVVKGEAFLVVGEDVSLHHPVLALTIGEACSDNGASLYLLVTADSFLYKFAQVNTNPLPGYEERVLEALLAAVEGKDYEALLEGSGVDKEALEKVAQGLKEKKPVLVGGNRLFPKGRELLRKLGEVLGGELLFLDWGSNAKGAFQMGFWSSQGGSVEEILKQCASGEVKALFVSSMDLFRDYPNGALVKEALSNLDFLVVHDMFFTETASYSDCFIPATSFAEDGGTVVNLFWEPQNRKRALRPWGESLPLWKVALHLSKEWGEPLGDFQDVKEVSQLVSQELSKEPSQVHQLSSGGQVPLEGEGLPALFEYPFYKVGVAIDYCNAFVQLEPEPRVTLNAEYAEELGFKEGEKVAIEVGDLKFHLKLVVKDEVPPGGAVVSLGFSDFPITGALKGSWYARIKLSSIKE